MSSDASLPNPSSEQPPEAPSCAAWLADLPALDSRYELIREIGRGGMGVVCLAKDRNLGRIDVVKRLLPHLMDDEEFLERFRLEARTLARMSHDGIVDVLGLYRDDSGLPCIAMEYLDGEPLSVKVERDGPLPVEQALGYVAQAAESLDHVHRRGVVHRDLKPENLFLVRETGTVKVMDFGLVRRIARTHSGPIAEDEVIDEPADRLMGTFAYMSPEHLRMSDVNERSDVYSMGAVLYFLLTGSAPFTAANPLQVLSMHVNRPLPEVIRGRDGVPIPDRVARLVRSAMEKKQEARPQSAGEWARSIRKCLAAMAAESNSSQRTEVAHVPPSTGGGASSADARAQARSASSTAATEINDVSGLSLDGDSATGLVSVAVTPGAGVSGTPPPPSRDGAAVAGSGRGKGSSAVVSSAGALAAAAPGSASRAGDGPGSQSAPGSRAETLDRVRRRELKKARQRIWILSFAVVASLGVVAVWKLFGLGAGENADSPRGEAGGQRRGVEATPTPTARGAQGTAGEGARGSQPAGPAATPDAAVGDAASAPNSALQQAPAEPPGIDLVLSQAWCNLKNGRTDLAGRDFNRVKNLRLPRFEAEARLGLAYVHARKNDRDQALFYLTEIRDKYLDPLDFTIEGKVERYIHQIDNLKNAEIPPDYLLDCGETKRGS